MAFEITEALGASLTVRPPERHGVVGARDASASDGAGSDALLTALFREHHLGLVRLALLIVGDQGTAEDVVQDAFVAIHRKLDKLRDPANALPYIRTSVINGCRGVLRRRAVASRFGVAPEQPVWSAESAVLQGHDRREVFVALRSLPRRQREALVLRYYLDLSEAEIAAAMGVSRGTVKSTSSRALASLAKKLGEDS